MRLAAALALLCVPASPAAQTIVPVEQEPSHVIVFENAVVRVIDAAVPVGHETLYHTHSRDNVPVAVASGRVATTVIGRASVESDVRVGQVWFAAGGYTHVRSGMSARRRFAIIDVELRTSTPATTARRRGASPLAGHALELSNARVRVHRVIVGAGPAPRAHKHAGAVLEVLVGGDTVAHGAGIARPVAVGAFQWHADGALDTVRNAGRVPYEVVEIEWVN